MLRRHKCPCQRWPALAGRWEALHMEKALINISQTDEAINLLIKDQECVTEYFDYQVNPLVIF